MLLDELVGNKMIRLGDTGIVEGEPTYHVVELEGGHGGHVLILLLLHPPQLLEHAP